MTVPDAAEAIAALTERRHEPSPKLPHHENACARSKLDDRRKPIVLPDVRWNVGELWGSLGVPHQKSSTSPNKPVGTKTFRKHYDELEAKRAELLGRLAKLGGSGRKHSGYASALQLLQTRFRRATLAQRAAVLQSAAWMIELLEHLTSVL